MAALRASNVVSLANPASPNSPSTATDKRRAQRRRILKGAVAAFSNRHCSIACIVRDISLTGARIRSEGSVNIPDTFELLIELDGTEADCEVVWRKGNEIGVRFRGAPRRVNPCRQQSLNSTQPKLSIRTPRTS